MFSSIFHWIVANKAFSATIVAAILSETMPFIPIKYNGIAQGVLSVLRNGAGKPQG